MSAIPTHEVRQPAPPLREPPIRKLSVGEYNQMYEAGILVEAGLELIDGVIRYKSTQRIRPLSLIDYHRLLEIGILHEGDAVELIDGVMRYKMTKGTKHDSTVDKTAQRLGRLLPDMRVRVQSAVSFASSEPEPDIVIAIGPDDRYDDHHPRPNEILLVVEVADSSYYFDRGAKKASYASAGVVQYWVVSLPDRAVEINTEPTGADGAPRYREIIEVGEDESITVRIEGREVGKIAVRDILPRP